MSLFFVGCTAQEFPYDLNEPDAKFKLSDQLNEISGLQMLGDGQLAAVQDEKGIIFYLDAQTGNINSQFDFGKNSDYEGITQRKDNFYVLRSNGSILKVKKGKEAKEYKFKNNKNFDFEGICLDQSNKQLLVACKTHGDKDKRNHFYIYSFSLESKQYDKKPLFKIKKKEVHRNFSPSGISIHPNGNIYVLSSHSKTLLVLSPEGMILYKTQLNQLFFEQPEGITFSEKGGLYISNERNKGSASILYFKQVN